MIIQVFKCYQKLENAFICLRKICDNGISYKKLQPLKLKMQSKRETLEVKCENIKHSGKHWSMRAFHHHLYEVTASASMKVNC